MALQPESEATKKLVIAGKSIYFWVKICEHSTTGKHFASQAQRHAHQGWLRQYD